MYEIEYLRDQLKFELRDRAMSIAIGIGFLAMFGAGVWTVATGEPSGILPALAGAGLAAAEFHEASEASSDINKFRDQIIALEN